MNPSTALALVLVDELVRLGLRHAVLCPGSRSAPLAYALQEADRAGRLALHVRVDERSAAFLALGIGKVAGLPAAVVTTSGTAVANLHPAVLEASEASVPMLLLTADRPPELRGTRANQTTDQVNFFGHNVRLFHDIGTPADTHDGPAWRTAADRAFAAATGALGGDPGPAHLNIPLREPLVPDLDDPDGAIGQGGLVGRDDDQPWTRLPALSTDLVDRVPAAGDRSAGPDRTLVVIGDVPRPGDAADLASWARRQGWPVLAEPFGLRSPETCLPFAGLLAQLPPVVADLRPERILLAGRVTLSRSVAALLRAPGVQVDLCTPSPRWPDPGHVAHAVHSWPVPRSDSGYPAGAHAGATSAGEANAGPMAGSARPESAWHGAWQRAARSVGEGVASLLEEMWPFGPSIAREVLAAAHPGTLLYSGSSSIVRDLDLVRGDDEVMVVANRGLAGIDGTVSSAVGAALACPQRPAIGLMGDLAFLHDSNGLLIGPEEPRPDLTLIVVNDDGGGIFGLLEYGEPARAGQFERVFGTPTGVRIADLCGAHRVQHLRANTRKELADALSDQPRGIRVVEVCVDRATQRDRHEQLRAAARSAAVRALS